MMVSIEQHVDWIGDCLSQLRAQGATEIEPTPAAEAAWQQHCADCAAITLHTRTDSWYMGANVPGKPRGLMPYIGGVDAYRKTCDEVLARGLLGFETRGAAGTRRNEGALCQLQPDVRRVLDMVASLNLPTFDSLPVDAARALLAQLSAQRPPGPLPGMPWPSAGGAALAEVQDGSLPGATGPLAWRLYRPATPGPHPVVLYFHGGGWVLGDARSDDPLLRDLCVRSGALILSVDYRHAPEARFPAAVDDALAAARWVGAHAADIGGMPGQLAVAGWSAGGNLAAVVCQQLRDAADGPRISGQLLLTPVTDSGLDTASFEENAEGYGLTKPLMHWFWNHYCDPAQRGDPRASPLRAAHLAGLPPAVVVTCQFDPLRDQGRAYAEALAAAGVTVQQIQARGHTHTSLAMVDVVVSGEPVRAQMAQALRGFFTQ